MAIPFVTEYTVVKLEINCIHMHAHTQTHTHTRMHALLEDPGFLKPPVEKNVSRGKQITLETTQRGPAKQYY